jgi:hypothetical protein
MTGALQTDKLCDVFQVLAEYVLPVSREDRHRAHAELQQPLQSSGIVDDVNRNEVDAFFRKKLFRPQATASTRLGEQDKLVSGIFHA